MAIPTFPMAWMFNVGVEVREASLSDVDHVIGALASAQHGIVTRAQLEAARLARGAIEHRLRSGRLTTVHRGIYAVGHSALSDHSRVQAALLIAPGSGASREAALAIHGLTPSMPAVIDVAVLGRAPRNRPTVRFHERQHVEWMTVKGLNVTTPRQTLIDLGWPEKPTDEALAKRLVKPREIDRPPTRSHLEREFLRVITQAGLPQPLVNHRLGPYLLDFYWPEQRLVVETDGATHRYRRARRSDAARDAQLQRVGVKVVRFETDEVTHKPLRLVASLTTELRT
jgi:hypothetical protein